MKLIFEKNIDGVENNLLPACDVPAVLPSQQQLRDTPPLLPALTEGEIARHYSALERRTHGVNNGFYPLGSCTMKYNPKVNEEMAALPGFTDVHPLQPIESVQGALQVYALADELLSEITGMSQMCFEPAAGAQGEFTSIAMIKAYHAQNGDGATRTKVLVPDAAHGTNPASATMNGYQVVTIPSDENGCVDVGALRQAADEETAALMLTNPNTLGLFEPNITEITAIVHKAGGLNYYDGANLNPIMGVVRPGDMGFDIVHLNLHKTFSAPHGGGGPGSGAIGCKALLSDFLPTPLVATEDGQLFLDYNRPNSIGKVRSFYGNYLVVLKALCYILSLGGDGLKTAAHGATLNANYLMRQMATEDNLPYDKTCMHEFVLSMKALKKETGVSAVDVAKGLIDYGIHPPTMYFPLVVEEALMFEPTETETKETLDRAANAFNAIVALAKTDPEALKTAPHTTPISRPDEVQAARKPILRFVAEDA